MNAQRRVVLAVVLLVLFVLLASGFRVRISKARYHSESLDYWLKMFITEVIELQSTLAVSDDPQYLSRRFGEIRTAVRYLEMIIGRHDDRLGTLAGVTRIRAVPGGEFGRLWWAMRRVQSALMDDPPPDLADRTARAAGLVEDAAREMRRLLRAPEGRALGTVRVLSPRQKTGFNDLIIRVVDALDEIID